MKKNSKKNRISCLVVCLYLSCLAMWTWPAGAGAEGENAGPGTSAHDFYIAQGIIDTYSAMFDIRNEFQRKPISDNLNSRNVFPRALAALDEFNALFPDVIHRTNIDAAHAVGLDKAGPMEIMAVLTLMQEALAQQTAFQEYTGTKTSKSSSELYQILRELGWFHREIAKKKRMTVTWDKVERVYETVITGLLPSVYKAAETRSVRHENYPFPKQPVDNVTPHNIYKLITVLYNDLMSLQPRDGARDAVRILPVNDCDTVTPAEVFDLEQVVVAELAARDPSLTVPRNIGEAYAEWKKGRDKLAPGHTFRLLQHLYDIIKEIRIAHP